jgi:hypothetical protein
MLDEVATGQALDLPFVHRGLIAEVEGFQRLDEREARHGRAHRNVLGGLGGDLLAQDLLQELRVGQLLGRGLLQPAPRAARCS